MLVVVLAGCWRGSPSSQAQAPASLTQHEPVSFVVRVTGLAELQHGSATLGSKLTAARQRILGLADETERDVISDDLHTLADDVARLAERSHNARARGDDAAVLDQIDRSLTDAVTTLAKLRHGLRYANTLEQLQAYTPVEPTVRRHVGVSDFTRPWP
jgi:hypothetical protein